MSFIEYHFSAEFYYRLLKPGLEQKPVSKSGEQTQHDTLVVPQEEFLTPRTR